MARGMDSETLCASCFAQLQTPAASTAAQAPQTHHPGNASTSLDSDGGAGWAGPCPRCGWNAETGRVNEDELAPGTLLRSRYQVGRVLGRGGFGITYLGFDRRLRRRRAIKEYFPRGILTRAASGTRVTVFSSQKELYQRGMDAYLAEAQLLARFENHACIVSPLDFFEENGTAYLVMEHLDGETLRRYVERLGGRLPYEHVCYFLDPVLDALAAVHDAGITHRDVSPDNIFLTIESRSKLIDFGAARQGLAARSGGATVIVKDHYAPPEQYAREGKQGPWTDVYAAAATIYFALTGKTPPTGPERLLNDDLKPPSKLGIKLPRGVEATLMRCLALRPEARPQQITELRRALVLPTGSRPTTSRVIGHDGEFGALADDATIRVSAEALDSARNAAARERGARPDAGNASASKPSSGSYPLSYSEAYSNSHADADAELDARTDPASVAVARPRVRPEREGPSPIQRGLAGLATFGRQIGALASSVRMHAVALGRAGFVRVRDAAGRLATGFASGWRGALELAAASSRWIGRTPPALILQLSGATLVLLVVLGAGWWLLQPGAPSLNGADRTPAVGTQATPQLPSERVPPRPGPVPPAFAGSGVPSGEPSNETDTDRVPELGGPGPSGPNVNAASPDGTGPRLPRRPDSAPSPGDTKAEVLPDAAQLNAQDSAAIEPESPRRIEGGSRSSESESGLTATLPTVSSSDPPTNPTQDPGPSTVAVVPTDALLIVRSNVSRDRLWIDDELVGSTGPRIISLPPGPHRVRVEMLGFVTEERTVNLVASAKPRTERINLRKVRPPDDVDWEAKFAATGAAQQSALVEQVQTDAEKGSASAQHYLARLHISGQGVPKNEVLALDWMRKAAGRGLMRAQLELGLRLEYDGWDPKVDERKKVSRWWWEDWLPRRKGKTTEQLAQEFVSKLEQNRGDEWGGPAVPIEENATKAQLEKSPRFVEAMKWYIAAARQGSPLAQERAGFMRAGGRGTDANVTTACRQWFMQAAAQGRSDSQYIVGMCYTLAIGFPDSEESRQAGECWLQAAAAQKQPAAIPQLEAMGVAPTPPEGACPFRAFD